MTTRRKFLTTSAALSAAAFTAASYRRIYGANEKSLRIAQIGCGGQGRNHLSSFSTHADAQVVALCDPDRSHLAKAAERAPEAVHYGDLRKALDDASIDAVSIATPDHWHVPAALLALAAGKHVYVEKPCSHNLCEGRMLVDATKKSGLKVQHGTQSRSAPFIREAMKMLHDGVIGEVLMAKAWDVQFRGNIGHAKPSAPPEQVNYDNWVGPAVFVPFQSNRFHYTWHWWFDFGTGDVGNDGVHEIDYARWGLGVETHPSRISAIGGKYFHDDDQQFPDTLTAVMEYPGASSSGRSKQLIFELRLWSTNYPFNIDNGVEYYGTKGRMLITKRGKVEVQGERNKRLDVKLPKAEGVSIPDHQRNWFDAIRADKPLHAPAEVAHLSASICHLANASFKLGGQIEFDPERERTGDAAADKLLGREYRDHWGRPKGA